MKLTIRSLLSVVVLPFLATCSNPSPQQVRVRFAIAKTQTARETRPGIPADASDFTCFGLLVTGAGISSAESGPGGLLPSDYCAYAGISSSFLSGTGTIELELYLPPGRRRIQVLGLDTKSETCPTISVSQFLKDARNGESYVLPYGGLYELGYVEEVFLSDTTVVVPESYASTKDLRNCGEHSLRVAQGSSFMVGKPDPVILEGAGGTPPYTFAYVSGPDSGAVSISNGKYVYSSGSTNDGDTTVVRISDAAGYLTTASITTFDPPGKPYLWYVASEHTGYSDGATVTTPWYNRGTGSTPSNLTAVPVGGSSNIQYVANAVNGSPAIRLRNGSSFVSSTLPLATMDNAHALFVGKYLSRPSLSRTMFCLSSVATCTAAVDRFALLFNPGALAINDKLAASNGSVGNRTTASFDRPSSDYFIAEFGGDFTTNNVMRLSVDGSQVFGTAVASATNFTFSSATAFLGSPDGGALDVDVVEFILDFQTPANWGDTDYLGYLQSKYGL